MIDLILFLSIPIFSVRGDLPTATKTQSNSALSSSEKTTFESFISLTEEESLKSTPRLESCFLSSPDVLLSKPGSIS